MSSIPSIYEIVVVIIMIIIAVAITIFFFGTEDKNSSKYKYMYHPKMILITSYYESKDPRRKKEIDECLLRNVNNDLISRIYLLNEKEYHLPISNDKIIQINMKKRITYEDAFSFANQHCPEEICIIANSDIYYDDSLSLFHTMKEKDWEKTFFAITRYNEDGLLQGGSQGSQDTWVFKTPLLFNDEELREFRFHFGVPACDNRLVHIFHKNGYNVINPCKDIFTYHLHESNVRSYTNKDRLPGPVRYVHPSGLFPTEDMTSRFYIR